MIERESGTNINHQNELCLLDDVAVQVKSNPSGRPSFQLVRVVQIRNYGRGHTEYKKPVSLANTEKFPKLKVMTNVYVKNGEEYVYSKECNKEFPFNNIIMKIKVELKV